MNLDKSQYKSLGDVVGMPDEDDKKQIRRIIIRYNKKHPGEIQFHRDTARDRLTNEWSEVDDDSHRRYLMEIPEGLFAQLEAYIPTLFREKKHFAWFCKNFKELLIPRKY